MADRQIFGKPITDEDQWAVSTYLIAISPELQSSAKRRREQSLRSATAKAALATAVTSSAAAAPVGYDTGAARELFEETCSQCHETSEVQNYRLTSPDDVSDLLERMIGNGLDASGEELEHIAWFLSQTFAR